jgi:sirohydrochlorin cobaltochelatase
METVESRRRALVLFAHGARDPQWRAPFEQLLQRTQAQLPEVQVRLAFLEFMAPDLSRAVRDLAQLDCDQLTLVPIFLGQGGHVRRDLPALIAQLQRDHPHMAINMVPAVGEDSAVLDAMAHYCITALEP